MRVPYDINSGPGFQMEVEMGLYSWGRNLKRFFGRKEPLDLIKIERSYKKDISENKMKEIYDASKTIEERARKVSEKAGMPLSQVYKEIGFDPKIFVDDFSRDPDYFSGFVTPEEVVQYSTEELEKIEEKELFESRPEWFEFLNPDNTESTKYKDNHRSNILKKIVKVGVASAALLTLPMLTGCIGHTPQPSAYESIKEKVYIENDMIYLPDEINGINILPENSSLENYSVIGILPFGELNSLLPSDHLQAREYVVEKTLEKAMNTKGADAIIADTWLNEKFGYSDMGIGLVLNKTGPSHLTGLPSEIEGLPLKILNKELVPQEYSLGIGPIGLSKDTLKFIQDFNSVKDTSEQIKAIGILPVGNSTVAYLMQGANMNENIPMKYYSQAD